jgi:Growth inhibitor
MQKYDIFYCDLGKNLGSEQGGIRPCIILQNNTGNKYSPTTIIAPFTTATKHPLPTHIPLNLHGRDSYILLEQIRVIDKSRIKNFYGKVDDIELQKKIQTAIKVSLNLD